MKYLVKNLIASITIASMVISTSISSTTNIYANEVIPEILEGEGENIIDEIIINNDTEEVIDDNTIVDETIDNPDRNIDNFIPITPELPVIEDNSNDGESDNIFTPLTPEIQPIIDSDELPTALNYEIQQTPYESIMLDEYFLFDVNTGTLNGMNPEYSNEIATLVAENNGVLVIPEKISDVDVTIIGKEAFYDLKLDYIENLETIEIPNSVTKISEFAFSKSAINKIVIPDSVTSLEYKAFADCTSLSEVTLGAGITELGYSAFNGATALESIEIPSNVEIIYSAFYNSGLKTITFNEGLKHIRAYAFMNCKLSGEIIIPSTVETIEASAFLNTSGYEGEFMDYTNFDPNITESNNIEKLIFAEGENGSQIRFIGTEAFANNKIKTLELPNKSIEIQQLAFYNNEIENIILSETKRSRAPLNYMAFARNPLEFIEVKEGSTFIPTNMFAQSVDRESFYNFYRMFIPDVYTDLPVLEREAQSVYSDVKEIILPSTLTEISFDSIPVPKYAVTNKSDVPYSMYSQTYKMDKPDSFDYFGNENAFGDFEYTSVSLFGALDDEEAFIDGRYSKNWSADRLHTKPAEFFKGEYTLLDRYVVYSDYFVIGDIYKNYDVEIIELPDGVTFEDGSTSLKGKSFMTEEEMKDILNNNIPKKEGFEFSHWDFDAMNRSESFESFKFDKDEFNDYIINDIRGIKPVFIRTTEYIPITPTLPIDDNENIDLIPITPTLPIVDNENIDLIPITPSRPIVNNDDDDDDDNPDLPNITPTIPPKDDENEILYNIIGDEVPLGINKFDSDEATNDTVEYYDVENNELPLGTFEGKVNPKTGDKKPFTTALALLFASVSLGTIFKKKKNII